MTYGVLVIETLGMIGLELKSYIGSNEITIYCLKTSVSEAIINAIKSTSLDLILVLDGSLVGQVRLDGLEGIPIIIMHSIKPTSNLEHLNIIAEFSKPFDTNEMAVYIKHCFQLKNTPKN